MKCRKKGEWKEHISGYATGPNQVSIGLYSTPKYKYLRFYKVVLFVSESVTVSTFEQFWYGFKFCCMVFQQN